MHRYETNDKGSYNFLYISIVGMASVVKQYHHDMMWWKPKLRNRITYFIHQRESRQSFVLVLYDPKVRLFSNWFHVICMVCDVSQKVVVCLAQWWARRSENWIQIDIPINCFMFILIQTNRIAINVICIPKKPRKSNRFKLYLYTFRIVCFVFIYTYVYTYIYLYVDMFHVCAHLPLSKMVEYSAVLQRNIAVL